MQRKRSIWLLAGLLVIAAAVVVVGIKRSNLGTPKPPPWVDKQPAELIDIETLELITKSLGEWQELGMDHGKYKNPNTGRYTMVHPIRCPACGALIPGVERPPELQGDITDLEAVREIEQAFLRAKAEYKCPKCGHFAYR